jgi:hypothetical protein
MIECSRIEARDLQTGLEMAWHHKTNIVKEVTFDNAFGWEIERKPIFINSPKLKKIPGFSVFVCTDDGETAGKPVADTYHALTNREFFDVCKDSLAGTGSTIESAGTLMDRSRRFLTIKLPDDATKVGRREFKNRISLVDSIDGSTFFYGVNTSICVVCANTSRTVIGDHSGEFRYQIRHTAGLKTGIVNMEGQIERMLGVQAQFYAAMAMADETPVAPIEARNLFAGFLGDGAETLSTRTKNAVERIAEISRGGAGNRGETLLDAISGITDFYSHESSGGEDKPGFREKQSLSSEFGAGMRKKSEFISELFTTEKGRVTGLNNPRIATLMEMGEGLLK